ncbi:DUF4962 domain-containing protein [Vallitaleaceae bacterium 9-2]
MKEYIFIQQNIDELRSSIYTKRKKIFKRLDEQCARYHTMKLDEKHPEGSSTYMGIAIANLSLAYVLTKQKQYLEDARRFINTVVNYPHWGHAHLVDVDLSAAWILFGLGIGYDWLKDVIPKEEKEKIENKILLQSRRMYDFKIKTQGNGWSTNYWQNHNWINLTGLAVAGYALIKEKEYKNEAQNWVECAKENFELVYNYMPQDGSDYEGVVYWRYGAMWLFVYAHLIKEREGIDYFKKTDFLKNTFDYRLYQSAPNLEEQINFGDCHDKYSGHSTAIYYKTAAEYNNGYAQYMGNFVVDKHLYKEAFESNVKPGILPECFFEFLFYDPDISEKSFDDLPKIKFFEDLGLVIFRDSWDREALHLSFKCGAPGGKSQWQKLWELKKTKGYNCFGLSHQHPDNNSFILHYGGKFQAIDDGYNRNVKASDHNMILVDGQGFEDEGVNNVYKNYSQDMVGEMKHVDFTNNQLFAIGETAKTYKKELKMKQVERQVLTTDSGCIIFYDKVKSDNKHEYTWQMYTEVYPEEVELDSNKTKVKVQYKNGLTAMCLWQQASGEISVGHHLNTVRAVMTTQEPDNYRENQMKGLTTKNCQRNEQMEFLTVVKPYSAGIKCPVEVRFSQNSAREVIIQTSKKVEKYTIVDNKIKKVE